METRTGSRHADEQRGKAALVRQLSKVSFGSQSQVDTGLSNRRRARTPEAVPCTFLAELRVDFGQGYLFSRPVPAPELRKLLRHVGPLPTLPVMLDS